MGVIVLFSGAKVKKGAFVAGIFVAGAVVVATGACVAVAGASVMVGISTIVGAVAGVPCGAADGDGVSQLDRMATMDSQIRDKKTRCCRVREETVIA